MILGESFGIWLVYMCIFYICKRIFQPSVHPNVISATYTVIHCSLEFQKLKQECLPTNSGLTIIPHTIVAEMSNGSLPPNFEWMQSNFMYWKWTRNLKRSVSWIHSMQIFTDKSTMTKSYFYLGMYLFLNLLLWVLDFLPIFSAWCSPKYRDLCAEYFSFAGLFGLSRWHPPFGHHGPVLRREVFPGTRGAVVSCAACIP